MASNNLSDLILKKQFEATRHTLEARVCDPDDHDQYGTTPLINAVLMNHAPTVRALLEFGAAVDKQDTSGCSPLYWAVDNNNLEITEILLNAKANPNAFNHEGQPILTYPFLRGQTALKELLLKKGADITFTQDYVYTKLIGHRFELTGSVPIASPDNVLVEMDYEGFLPEFSVAGVRQSLQELVHHYSGRSFKQYFPYIAKVIQALIVAQELRMLRHRNVDLQEADPKINALLRKYPFLILPVTFEGHAITFVTLGAFFAHCDRGERSQTHDAVTIYQCLMPSQLNSAFLKKLLFQRQRKEFINIDLHRQLQLTPISSIPTRSQISGNCSWANVEASIPTLLYMLMKEANTAISAEQVQDTAVAFYEAWREWDKDRALDLCLEHFKEGSRPRKVSKANIMAAILFQACEPQNPIHHKRAEKILRILTEKPFDAILATYVQIYCKDLTVPQGKNLATLLQQCGVDYRNFL
jgi:Ankyrin repeats (3 copies)